MTAPVTTAAVGVAAYQVLDAAYRAQLARVSLSTARAMLAAWATVDANDLAGSSRTWLERSVELVLAGQRNAVVTANAYTTAVRRLAAPTAPVWTPPPARPPNVEQIRKSLIFTGLATTARQVAAVRSSTDDEIRAADEAVGQLFELDDVPAPVDRTSAQRTLAGRQRQLMVDGIARAAGSATRLITTAGRDQLEDNVRSDTAALGWVRTTKPGCCYFCAMLASRGFVYKKDSFEASNAQFRGVGEQKVHDSCGCGLRPVYTTDDPLPDRVAELDEMWATMEIKSGETAIQAFRRTYEASPLAQPAVSV